jgi:crotonobetainyl-CoA:carnitine CoA-transferase CaiB-like acyl-CoA transferase
MLALDLKKPGALEIVHRLLGKADVVHHNMRYKAAQRLKIDYDSLRKIKPDLIYCHTRAHDSNGWRTHLPGVDQTGNAIAGSEFEGGASHAGMPPIWYVVGFGDLGNGMLSAIGVIQALYHRGMTGEGQWVDTSILNAAMLFNSYTFIDSEGNGPDRSRLDAQQHGYSALYRLYRANDGWMCLAVLCEAEWRALDKALPELALAEDPRFESAAARRTNNEELIEVLEKSFARQPVQGLFVRLDGAGVPCEISSSSFARELIDEPTLRKRGWTVGYDHPLVGHLEQMGLFWEFSDTPGKIWGPPRLNGENTEDILREVGYDQKEIGAFYESGVVG